MGLTFFLSCVLLVSPVSASDLYFSPDGGVQDQIIRRINTSKATIDIAVYSFTAANIAEALGNASRRGVKIRIVRDASQSVNKNDENPYLKAQGVEVHVITGKGRGIMHNKFAVFDSKEACTGSYNWTNNAENNNYENCLCTDEVGVIQGFQKEFIDLWQVPEKPFKAKIKRQPQHTYY